VKDDGRPVDDPANRVAGVVNRQENRRAQAADRRGRSQAEAKAREMGEAATTARLARERANAAHELLAIVDFSEIDSSGLG